MGLLLATRVVERARLLEKLRHSAGKDSVMGLCRERCSAGECAVFSAERLAFLNRWAIELSTLSAELRGVESKGRLKGGSKAARMRVPAGERDSVDVEISGPK